MEKLRFGFIGAGGISHGHAKRITSSGQGEVVAIAEPSAASVQRFRQATSLEPRVYPDHRSMLAAERLDCVLVASPHTQHFAQSQDALAAGLHVLCEKPMVCSTAEARALLETIARSGRTFMISYQRHLEPAFLWMKEQVASGALGRLTYVAATLCQEWLQGVAGTWRQDPALSGGGQINDSGSHFVDVIIWLGGPVEAVHAFMDNRGTRVDINSAVSFRYKSGAIGTFTVVGDSHAWWEDWTVGGEAATLFYRNGRCFRAVYGQRLQEVAPESLPSAPGNVDQAFMDAVAGRREVPVPATIGVGVIEFTEAAWRSAATGRPVQVAELQA